MSGKEYRTITDVKGPLVFLNKTEPVAFGEIVTIRLADGSIKNGQVLDTSDELVIVQVFEGTANINRESGVTFMGDVFKLPVSTELVGRILDGAGRPRDGGPAIVAEENADIIGAAINPYSRQSPQESRQLIAVLRLYVGKNCQFSQHLVCLTTIVLCKLPDKQS